MSAREDVYRVVDQILSERLPEEVIPEEPFEALRDALVDGLLGIFPVEPARATILSDDGHRLVLRTGDGRTLTMTGYGRMRDE